VDFFSTFRKPKIWIKFNGSTGYSVYYIVNEVTKCSVLEIVRMPGVISHAPIRPRVRLPKPEEAGWAESNVIDDPVGRISIAAKPSGRSELL